VKRHELLGRIAKVARAQGIAWQLDRQGAGHEIWRCGRTAVVVPRHKEISDELARAVFTDLEAEFGKGWWRR
jgi:hypothetical protein